MSDLIDEVLSGLDKAGVEAGSRLLVACSGGPDSTALLDLLHRLAPSKRFFLGVASLNHGLRPEAAAEVALVARLAQERGLEFWTELRRPDKPTQAAARAVRFAFLDEALKKSGADLIALGHTADDQAETIIMRLIRGCGPTGLAGIPWKNETLVRPLLGVTRSEILKYLAWRKLLFVRDPSNQDRRYLRVRVRRDILPRLIAENPRLVSSLTRLSEMMRAEDAFMIRLARRELERMSRPLEGRPPSVEMSLALDRKALSGLDRALARRVLRAALLKAHGGLSRITNEHVDKILALCRRREAAALDLPYGDRIFFEGRELRITAPDFGGPKGLHSVLIRDFGAYDLSADLRLEVRPEPAPKTFKTGPWEALMDVEAVSWPLLVRSPRPGDRIQPLGMTGSKKLSDLFIDKKVPRRERARRPVVLSKGQVIWVAGCAVAASVALGKYSRQALRLTLFGQMT